ncbi:O-antigen ligase [uncultured Winogradskyella sp.]|uniref:O-antigen ligase family protein n=1 Tax=uncultured Winogradskyella sp. TaxID=395353 RepID=UPI0026166D11|nr:O-antigen ligase family protein [uncultured Winogradskyella sp.]
MYKKVISFLHVFKNEILLSSLFIFPLLSINYIGFLGVLVSILLIIINFKKEKLVFKTKAVVLSMAFYALLLFSLIYSQNISNGFKEIGKTILIAVFPISIIVFSRIRKEWFNQMLLLFVIINIILCSYIFGLAIEILSYKKMIFLKEANIFEKINTFIKTPYNIPFNWSSRNFEVYLFFHKAYISLSLCLSALAGFYLLINKKKRVLETVLLIIATVIISYFVFYMRSAPNMMGYVIGILILSLSFFKNKPKRIIVTLTLILGLGFFFKGKIVNASSKLLTQIENDFRKDIWLCGWEVTKSNLVLGLGLGDQEDIMLDCYKEKLEQPSYLKIYEEKMNSHNQYISFVMSAGVICLIAFLLLIYRNISAAIKTSDLLFLAFMVLILINFLFENILDRIYGVFFFSFFNSFFIKRNITL